MKQTVVGRFISVALLSLLFAKNYTGAFEKRVGLLKYCWSLFSGQNV